MNNIVNIINLAVDTKFDSLFNSNFKTMKCKLDKKQLIDVLIKPSSPIIFHQLVILYEKMDKKMVLEQVEKEENIIEDIFKYTDLKNRNKIFDNEKLYNRKIKNE